MTTEQKERNKLVELSVPELVVIDFDRTLGDVDASMTRLYTAAKECGIEVEQIKQARSRVENDGGSFDPFSFIQETLKEEAMERFTRSFVSEDGPAILYPDTQPFLDVLNKKGVPYHVLTYGVNPEWQRLKVQASRYKGSMTVVNHTDKGKEIMSWENMTNGYSLTQTVGEPRIIRATTASLIDDKAAAFESLPTNCQGFLLQRSKDLLPSQKGILPGNVQVIKSLGELQIVNGKLSAK